MDGVVGPQTWGKLLAGQATVRRGSKGFAVRLAQGLVVAAGWNIKVDGEFGPATQGAVRAFSARRRSPEPNPSGS